jgi:hypothetical protein
MESAKAGLAAANVSDDDDRFKRDNCHGRWLVGRCDCRPHRRAGPAGPNISWPSALPSQSATAPLALTATVAVQAAAAEAPALPAPIPPTARCLVRGQPPLHLLAVLAEPADRLPVLLVALARQGAPGITHTPAWRPMRRPRSPLLHQWQVFIWSRR